MAYVGGAIVLAAWLAAAASTSFAPIGAQPAPRAREDSAAARLGADVQAQAARLRHRLASAPVPQQPSRNPFTFAARETPRARAAVVRHVAEDLPPLPAPPPDPALALAGIAEQESERGPVRTAVIVGAADEVYMVTLGQGVAARYTVVGIGADAVELKDTITGSTRRLALR